ncbi:MULTISPECIES: ABC transporter ATP-binding protein [Sporosarcina]|uniref:ABC transporter ATP-binding protein n=1 Tax=Sporosarcina TaxID=1569 RepID=UPI00078C86C5|nr:MULTISPECIES: ABC transporter ATP-binding protein [Sporosarcina]AMQ06487.1 ABC transporter ATP-binding protein [Sporosarcina psychrophila]QNK86203.1 ABC transporter ATP-binding protein [Sporosarcina sp. resist]
MLQVKNLTVGYGKTEVVHNISFQVSQGEIVTILGANGAGKSTILNTIVALHKGKGGSICFQGKEISNDRPDQLVRKGIRIVPEGRQIFPQHTVMENILLGAHIVKDSKKTHVLIQSIFERFPRLEERKMQLGGTLSGGEQQMLAIARSLMTEPSFLILDEPSLGLAPIIVNEVFDLLKQINSSGVTVLLVEQMANSALKISDRAYVIETGRIVLEGTGEEILNNPDVAKAYLGNV